MKHEAKADHAASITRAKGKMFEYHVPSSDHIRVPDGLVVEELFPLAVGSIADFAAETVAKTLGLDLARVTTAAEVKFAAIALGAYVDAKLNDTVSPDLLLLSAAGYYLCDMPGNSLVQRRALGEFAERLPQVEAAIALGWVLGSPWNSAVPEVGGYLEAICDELQRFYTTGGSLADWIGLIRLQREVVYQHGSAQELLYSDLFCAVFVRRIENAARDLLPLFSGVPDASWLPYLQKESALRELWPSQRLFGQAQIYAGASAVVQMPTSAGKTKATELVLRSAFLSGRTVLALVVAPFKALCEEIANSLGASFAGEDVRVNHMADVLQPDLLEAFAELLKVEFERSSHILVVTPEKLLYVLRQRPDLLHKAGLVIYDEGHQFDNGVRGVTYELLITSIRRLLPVGSQTVLISAVIPNANALARWLLFDEDAVLADSSLQTQRSIAFSSWSGSVGQLRFFDTLGAAESFFVPRVVVQKELERRGRERKVRRFPEVNDVASMALFLGLKVVANGAVAVFCGKKDSASSLLHDAVDLAARGVDFSSASRACEANELSRLTDLFKENFGEDCYVTQMAGLGVFSHHGDTPHGVRLAVEHAMREAKIGFVVCTSTLAQGVNLPIRYLIVNGTRQGVSQIKVRDFHNLMGRAGRAGIHGEGTVLFADTKLYDLRKSFKDSWRWSEVNDLLSPDKAEPTGSELLVLLQPVLSEDGRHRLALSVEEMVETLLRNEEGLREWLENIPVDLSDMKFSRAFVLRQFERRWEILKAVQSYVLAHSPDGAQAGEAQWSRQLAKETFAYSLADEQQQAQLENIFSSVAEQISELVEDSPKRVRFGRTLLGVQDCLRIDAWVSEHIEDIVQELSAGALLASVWPLLLEIGRGNLISTVEPPEAGLDLAGLWMDGVPYKELLSAFEARSATYVWGKSRRKFDIDDVVNICEQTFGFNYPLVVAALREAVAEKLASDARKGRVLLHIDRMHRRLKYGVPNQNCTFLYEAGFAERVVVQRIEKAVWGKAESVDEARALIREWAGRVGEVVRDLPSYYQSVFHQIVSEGA